MNDPDEESLARLCRALNEHHVSYVVFGSFAGRLQGANLHTVDVDLVPEASDANLQRLCDAVSSLNPRWRVDDVSEGLRIDGDRLEPLTARPSPKPLSGVLDDMTDDLRTIPTPDDSTGHPSTMSTHIVPY